MLFAHLQKELAVKIQPAHAPLFVLILLSALASPAQGPSAGRIESLVGAWKGEGKLLGMASRAEMKWEPVLSGRFTRLTYRAEMRTPDGSTQVFEGHGYYRSLGDGKYAGAWFDSQGDHHPIAAVFQGGALTATWGTEASKLGRTTYQMVGANRLEVIDEIRAKDGAWQQFGRATLSRE